jgi:hypothetical protein
VALTNLTRRLLGVASNTERAKAYFRRLQRDWAFRREVLKTSPIAVGRSDSFAVHVLCGRRTVVEAVATLKSFCRFTEGRHQVAVHDDGTLGPRELAILRQHLPGIDIHPRALADREVGALLTAGGWTRCAELRRTLFFSLKLFDLRHYAQGKPVLYLDTDILFHQPPDDLLAVLRTPPDEWVDRYNEDVVSSYAWKTEVIRETLGVDILPRVNAGFLCLLRENPDWDFFERALTLLPKPDDMFYAEQTLNAIELTVRGARPLPPSYDVCFRHAWSGDGDFDEFVAEKRRGQPVISQHYCGGTLKRVQYYEHFTRDIRPSLDERR